MNEVKIFNSPQFGEIRTTGTSDNPLFCLADLCSAIGLKDVSRCASRLDDDMRQTHPILDRLGREQQAIFVSEAGMYDVIIRSDSDKARPFRRWITSEVLPSIRRTGGYSVENSGATTAHPTTTVKAKIAAAKFLASFLNLNESSKLLIAKSIADPLGLPTPDYTPSKGILKSASELLKENGSPMSAREFNAKLMKLGYLTELTRRSSKGGVKKFKSITAKGLEYGENQVNPNNPKSTQPLWYADRFNEFMNVVK